MKILIAEDEPTYRHLLEEILIKWGYDLVVARDGNEAYQILLTDNAPKLAILGWKMPGMEGIEICQKIRKDADDFYTANVRFNREIWRQGISGHSPRVLPGVRCCFCQ